MRPLKQGVRGRFQRHDWHTNACGEWVGVDPCGVVIHRHPREHELSRMAAREPAVACVSTRTQSGIADVAGRCHELVDDGRMAQTGSRRSRSSVVIVTGVPGSGKTTLGSALAIALGARFLSLDAIKERLYHRGAENRDQFGLRLAAEAELVAQLVAEQGTVVVDIWIAPGRDTDRVTTLLQHQGKHIVEVLCRVPTDVAVDRYTRRKRSRPHLPPDEPTLRRIRDAIDVLQPMGIGTCIELDTSRPVDIYGVLDRLPVTRQP
ncbi:MAG: AAA family ATPase [Nocardioidaceae bacterium]